MGIFMTGCSDDDYSISNTPLLTDESVTTGSADVTVTSATFHGTVKGLEEQNASAYALGFYYGKSEDNLSEKVAASGSNEFQATVSGMPGDVVYYTGFSRRELASAVPRINGCGRGESGQERDGPGTKAESLYCLDLYG